MPDTLEELIKLPGIGRKTANLVMGDIFGKPAVVVDTHCIRITRRLGLHNEKDPKKIEFILRDLLPPEESNDFCHRLVLHQWEGNTKPLSTYYIKSICKRIFQAKLTVNQLCNEK